MYKSNSLGQFIISCTKALLNHSTSSNVYGKFLLSSVHSPHPQSFSLGGKGNNPCYSSKEEVTVSSIEQIGPILSPPPWHWGLGCINKLMAALARGWCPRWNSNLLCWPKPTVVISTHSSCRDFGGPEGCCCHCLLRVGGTMAARLSPAPQQFVDREQVQWSSWARLEFHG